MAGANFSPVLVTDFRWPVVVHATKGTRIGVCNRYLQTKPDIWYS